MCFRKPSPLADMRFASNGLPVHENFSAWFGQSVLVDESGEPLVLYHGTTKAIDIFELSPEGSFGAGIYLAPDPETADLFTPQSGEDGENIVPVYVRMERPFRVNACYEAGEAYDLDSQAIELVTAIFGEDEARNLINATREGSGHFGAEIRDRLLDLGHDGIIARYPDGSLEYVALFADQIKSALGNSGMYLRDSASLSDPIRKPGDRRMRMR